MTDSMSFTLKHKQFFSISTLKLSEKSGTSPAAK